MNKKQTALIALCLVIVGWVLMFPTTHPASSSPMLDITLTPTTEPETPTLTPHVPEITVTPEVPTLPPPPPPPVETQVLIPVTGADRSVAAGGGMLVTTGLIVLAIGMVCLGLSMRKK